MKITGIQIKVITIKNEQWEEGVKYMNEQGYQVLHSETHNDLVTIAGQKGENIVRYNLKRKTLEMLRYWAGVDGLSVNRSKVVSVDLSKRDLKELFQEQKDSCANVFEKQFFWEKWNKIGSIEALFLKNASERRGILREAGIDPVKKVARTVGLKKDELIEKLIMSGIKTYAAFSDFLATSY